MVAPTYCNPIYTVQTKIYLPPHNTAQNEKEFLLFSILLEIGMRV